MRHLTALLVALALAGCAATPAPTAVLPQQTAAPIPTTTLPPTVAPAATFAQTDAPAPTAAPAPTNGPQSSPARPAAVSLTLWHDYATGGAEEQTISLLVEKYVALNPNVKVKLQAIAPDQIINQWSAGVNAGGSSADLFTAPNDHLGDWVRAGLVAPLDSQLAGKLAGMPLTTVNGATVDGHIYAVPGLATAVALVYNKATIPTPPATTDDLMALVKSGKRLVIDESNYYLYGFFPSFGGQLLDSTGRCIADQGGYADAMQYLLDLKAAGADFESDEGKVDSLFETGKADMTIEGPWALAEMKRALGDNLGVAPLPSGPDGPSRPLAGLEGFYINPKSSHIDAAVALAQFIFSKQGLAFYADLAGDPPARTDVSVSDPLVKAYADAAAAGTPRPQSKEFNQWWGPFGLMVTQVVQDGQTPARAVTAACAAMNKANGE